MSGFAWSGFGLAAVNFVYEASEAKNRTKHIALFNATDGVAVCIGALIGGYLVPHLPAILGYQLRTLFTISGVLRGLVVVLMLRKILEVRRVPKLSLFQFLMGRSGTVPAEESKKQPYSFHLPLTKSQEPEDSPPEDEDRK